MAALETENVLRGRTASEVGIELIGRTAFEVDSEICSELTFETEIELPGSSDGELARETKLACD